MTKESAQAPYCASAPCGTGWTAANDGSGTWLCNKCNRVSKAVYFNMLNNPNQRVSNTMAPKAASTNNNIDTASLIADLIAVLQKHAGSEPVVAEPPAKSKAKAAPEIDDETGVEAGTERRAELEGMTLAALRKAAIAAGFEKDDVKGASKEDIIESLLDDEDVEQEDEDDEVAESEDDDEDVAESEDEDDEDDGESEGYTAEDLEDLGLTALKKIAKDEFDETTASLKGLDREDVMAIILGESDEDADEDEDEDEADEDDEDEYTEEDLESMSLAEVRALCKEYGVTVKPGMKKAALIEAFFEDED